MAVLLRPARLDDAEALARLHVRTWQHAYVGMVPASYLASLNEQEWAERWRIRLTRRPAFRTLVAQEAGELPASEPLTDAPPASELRGFVTCGPYRHESGDLDPAVGEIVAIYVHPDAQGMGTGRALMDEAIASLAASGLTEVRLWVLEHNTPSRRFYERYGLTPDGARQTYRIEVPGEGPVDLPEVRYAMRINGRLGAGQPVTTLATPPA